MNYNILLCQIRGSRGAAPQLTWRAVAHACGVSVSTVKAWDAGKREPSLEHQAQLLALARLRWGDDA